MNPWRILQDGPGDAAWNMAVDEAIAESCRRGTSPPTLRFYTWARPALTIGYFQRADRDIDPEACQAGKIALVRRITGGRAVLHGSDLTYSIASGRRVPQLPETIRGAFLAISQGFIEGLNRLGLEMKAVQAPHKDSGRSPLCFASTSWYEIAYQGRKIIGSAQRRWKDGFLQQGTLLLDFDPETFCKLLRFTDDLQRGRILHQCRAGIVGLRDLLPTRWDSTAVSIEIAAGFEKALGISFKPGGLSLFEQERARVLANSKYSQASWNLTRSPALFDNF